MIKLSGNIKIWHGDYKHKNGDAELISSNCKLILKVPFEDTGFFGAYHLKKGENTLYASLPMGKDKASLVSINIDTKEIKILCNSDEADVYLSRRVSNRS